MKDIQNKLILLFLLALVLPTISFSQDELGPELTFEVNKVLPYIAITKAQLDEAKTLIDLDERYKATWVKEYQSVAILTSHNGKIKKAFSKNDVLTQEQKDNMKVADSGKDITVKVNYTPKNSLKNNEDKEMNFSFHVFPENEAKYTEGQDALRKYLKENLINKIPDGLFTGFKLAAVTFTINEEGQVLDPQLASASEDDRIDDLLLKTIANMPCWTPAKYATGVKVKQAFALSVGNHESCVINLLNIRHLSPE